MKKIKLTNKDTGEVTEHEGLKDACKAANTSYQNVLNKRSQKKTTTYENRYVKIEEV